VTASPDGTTVFVTGASSGTIAGQVDYATVGYNAATGARLWVKRYAGLAKGGIGTHAYSVAVSPSGSTVYVTGESGNDSVSATVAYTRRNRCPAVGEELHRQRPQRQRCAGGRRQPRHRDGVRHRVQFRVRLRPMTTPRSPTRVDVQPQA
jgi:DNA-binding beta-propeller fold protein YncE